MRYAGRSFVVLALLVLSVTVPAHASGGSGPQEAAGPAAGVVLGPASRQCLGCHSGELSGRVVSHKGGTEHPVGMDYGALAGGNPSLVPASSLNRALRLEDGRVGCVTCHVPYDRANHRELARKRARMYMDEADPMLVLDSRGSALCTACHRK